MKKMWNRSRPSLAKFYPNLLEHKRIMVIVTLCRNVVVENKSEQLINRSPVRSLLRITNHNIRGYNLVNAKRFLVRRDKRHYSIDDPKKDQQ